MKAISKISMLLFASVFLFTDSNAQISAGAGIIYGFEIERIGIRADGVYTINDDWRAAADFGYYFPESEFGFKISWWELNVNAHYIFLDNDEFRVYGLAGLNYLNFNFSEDDNSQGLLPGNSGDFFSQTAGKETDDSFVLDHTDRQMHVPTDSFLTFSTFEYSGSETGLNVGVGGEFKLSFGSAFAEIKYAGIGGNADQLVFGAGVRYHF